MQPTETKTRTKITISFAIYLSKKTNRTVIIRAAALSIATLGNC